MLSLRLLTVVSLVSGLALSAAAAETLEHKYVEGRKSVVHTESKTEQVLTIAGMDLETKATTFIVSNSVVGQRAADGSLPITERVEVLQSDLQLPGGLSLNFDSANPDKAADNALLEPLLKVYRALLKTPTVTTLDKANEVQEVRFEGDAVDQLEPQFRGQFNADGRKKAVAEARKYLPDGPVQVGDKWERFVDAPIGGGQTLSFKIVFEYAGAVTENGRKLHKILSKPTEVSYFMEPNANSPLKIAQSDLKVTEAGGTILFDAEQGQAASRESKTRIQGTLTVIAQGVELPGKLDLTLTEKVTLQR